MINSLNLRDKMKIEAKLRLAEIERLEAKKKKAKKKGKHKFRTIPNGTHVTWHYRTAIGHGTVIGIHKLGTSSANTEYSIREHDHHPGENAVLHHYGKALTVVSK